MTAPTVTPTSPFDRHIATLNRTDLMSLLAARHSVRSFTDRPIEEGAVEQLQAEADAADARRMDDALRIAKMAFAAAGFELVERIVLKNVRTGKVYR